MRKLFLNRSNEIALNEILYLKSDENYTSVHTVNNERLVVSRTLRVMEDRIDEQSFIRINNSHVINLSFITACRRDDRRLIIMLDDGQEFYVSRRRVVAFRALIRKSDKANILRKSKA